MWDRFLNSGGRLNVYGHAFMAVGLIYAALSWLNYLSLDGVNAPKIFKKKLFKRPPKRKMGDMIDYVDEKVVSFEELDDDERTAASFVANLLAAVLFLIPCIILHYQNSKKGGLSRRFLIYITPSKAHADCSMRRRQPPRPLRKGQSLLRAFRRA